MVAYALPDLERNSDMPLFDLMRGRWWHALMLDDAATAALVCIQPAANLAQEYLFTQSRTCDRPLYTQEAEQRGAKVTFYFYSTNSEPLAQPSGRQKQLYMWQAMNWPRYSPAGIRIDAKMHLRPEEP